MIDQADIDQADIDQARLMVIVKGDLVGPPTISRHRGC